MRFDDRSYRRAWVSVLAFMAPFLFSIPPVVAAPLTTMEYRVVGQQLSVSPAAVAVPKGIPGSVLTTVAGDLPAGAFVEATLRGPSFPARRLVAAPNEPLLLPPLNLVGDYSLDAIRLIDPATGGTLLEGSPSSVPVRVFDEVLVARVTSRPLSSDEIRERGIYIDENNFRALEFEVGFVVDGETFPVKFPVVSPAFRGNTEIIPEAELEEALAQAEAINNQLALQADLPPELETANLNIQVKGLNVQFVNPGGDQELALQVPPIAGLMVIPGNIGFLNQFFSVMVFVENAAPGDSGLSVNQVTAEVVLPPGEDRVPGTWENPGDDPLRMARLGPDEIMDTVQPVVRPGPDGILGTADDIPRLRPREVGEAEFLVEGLREGLHLIDVKLRGTLEGLAAGPVEVEGKAAGSVLVRNPNFSLAFSHPRTVRSGEPYTASVTILNTSPTPANQVNVTLPTASISGAILESEATVFLGDILPGETKTATYELRSQRTGSITFSNLSSDDDIVGRFRLRMGVDERGVALSPDAIGYPDFVDDLPPALLRAADRVLGQALSVATAGQLPPGVTRVKRSTITTRSLELAEAGQRIRYSDTLERVIVDLLFDWQGARVFDAGFDQILRRTDAGREWREMLAGLLLDLGDPSLGAALDRLLPDIAGRGEAWWIAASDPAMGISFTAGDKTAGTDQSTLAGAAGYAAGGGGVVVAPLTEGGRFQWTVGEAVSGAEISFFRVGDDGFARRHLWSNLDLPAGARASLDPSAEPVALLIDLNGNGQVDETLVSAGQEVAEAFPEILAVVQDTSVRVGRPTNPCLFSPYQNYGTVLAVLFNKPMERAGAVRPGAYVVGGDNPAVTASLQPGGRMVLLNLQRGVGMIVPRDITVSGVNDPRGLPLAETTLPVQTTALMGTAVQGRVLRANGEPAAGVPVTLTYFEETGLFCTTLTLRPSQVFTDEEGRFEIDFILAGIPYSLGATDTGGLSAGALDVIMASGAEAGAVRAKLLELAEDPAFRDTLLAEFSVGAMPEAIAVAEGLDRALIRETLESSSPRVGTVQPMILRFRGRGTVEGQVLTESGSPVPGAAVNLFPDPDSREKGRGLFADSDGRFVFYGVPLGNYSLRAASSDGRRRDVAGVLDTPGQRAVEEIFLASTATPLTTLRGRVFEANGTTPHANARVFVGRYSSDGRFRNVVALADADADGFWTANNVPVSTRDVIAVSSDGQRKGERRDIAAVAGASTPLSIILQDAATVRGRVEFANGAPVPNALVAGGAALVRTDANGLFELTGVPTGQRNLAAGIEADPAGGIPFARTGNERVDVVPGDSTFTVIRFVPRGSITGRVLDQSGEPVTGINVSLPLDQFSFAWTPVDEDGVYRFDNIALGDHIVSAPGPAAQSTDTSGLVATIGNPESSQQDIVAAVVEAFEIFTGVNNPLLTGEGDNFNPIAWGYEEIRLVFDGQVINRDIVFLPNGTVSGTVVNGQGVPIGARVRLTGIGPTSNGDLGFIIRGERDSDPATGVFEFPGQLLAGAFGLQTVSPFFPSVISFNGATNRLDPDATDIVLQFPASQEINGRLTGTVFYPDGTPVGEDVNVKISFGDDYVIRTNEDGFFDTQIQLPALTDGRPGRFYSIEAEDPLTGFVGRGTVSLMPGIVNESNVTLLGRGGLDIVVEDASGAPVPGATVTVRGGAFPRETFDLAMDGNGSASLSGLSEGPYSVRAEATLGAAIVRGTRNVSVNRDATASVVVRLQPTGTITGRFLDADGITPIPGAQVTLGNSFAFAVTDGEGRFEVSGLPLNTYRVLAIDAATGRYALRNATLSTDGQTVNVTLGVQTTGELTGSVINSQRTGTVSGANVTLRILDGVSSERSVSTGPDGAFTFPGVPPGPFSLTANDPVSGISGAVNDTFPEATPVHTRNVELAPRAVVNVEVFLPDGVTPAAGAVVSLAVGLLEPVFVDADEEGIARFSGIPFGTVHLTGRETGNRDRSGVRRSFNVNTPGENAPRTLVLEGVGSVSGTVFGSDGVTPLSNTAVQLRDESPVLGTVNRTTVTDGAGNYSFENIAVGPYRLQVEALALAASHNGTITADGQADNADLTLGASGSVVGRLLRADGETPVEGLSVSLEFTPQSGALGVAVDTTDADGRFTMTGIPVGAVFFEGLLPEVNGIARAFGELTLNGEELDLGDILMDEDDPFIETVDPVNESVDVSVDTAVLVTFNEAMDPESIDPTGIFLRTGGAVVPATLALEEDEDDVARIVRLTPDAQLASEVTYELVVLDGDRVAAGTGAITARGPRDLVGRPLLVPFTSRFTTIDADPPVLVSFTPEDDAVQIDPRAVIRVAFNEPLRREPIEVVLTGPGGPVAGAVSLGLNDQVVVFTPEIELEPNATYTVSVSGIVDLAGNVAEDEPFTATFDTIRTIGPTVADIVIAGDAVPVAGSTVTFEAVLAEANPQARVRMSVDLVPIGESTTPGDLGVPILLPPPSTFTVRAIAIDEFGNEGPFYAKDFTSVANVPPVITFTRVNPSSGPLPTGSPFSVRVNAIDDAGIAELRAAAGGAATIPLAVTSDDSITLTGVVPATAAPTSVMFFASAIDGTGTSSGEQTFVVPVADATPPQLTVTSPVEGALVRPDEPLSVALTWSDNSGAVTLRATVTGDASGSAEKEASGTRNTQIPASLVVDLADASDEGGSLTLTVTATDAAGNETSVTHSLVLSDVSAPRIVERSPEVDTDAAGVLEIVELRFSKPLDPATVEDAVTVRDGSLALSGEVEQSAPDTLTWTPTEPLPFGATLDVEVAATLADEVGLTFGGETFGFTVTTAQVQSPVDAADYVETQEIDFSALIENTDDIDGVVLRMGGGGAVVFAEAAFSAAFNLPTLADVGLDPAADDATVPFAVYALIGGGGEAVPGGWTGAGARFVVPLFSGTLTLHNLEADSDGDGLPNWYEIAIGSDPFTPDSHLDFDGDGLTNLEEFERGTDPNLADTDGDGIPDGVDPRPLTPNSPPAAGAEFARTALFFDGENSYVEAHENLDPLNSFGPGMTLMAWVRAEPGAEGPMEIISRYRPGVSSGFGTSSRWRLFLDEDGQPAFDLQGRPAGATFRVSDRYFLAGRRNTVADITAPPVDLRDGQWHHVAAVFDRATDRMALYVNGALQNERTDVADIFVVDTMGTAPFSVGRQYREINGNEPRYYFQGHIAEVAVFGRALPQEELRGRFQRPLTGNETELRVYWRMDEGSGAPVVDQSSPSVTGTPGAAGPAADDSTQPPQRRDFGLTTDAGTALEFSLPALDADGDALTLRITQLPAHGDLLLDGEPHADTSVEFAADAVLTYLPSAGFSGVDDVFYEADDDLETSLPARLRFTVESGVPVVTAGELDLTIFQEQPVTFTVEELLGTGSASSGTLRILAVHGAANGTLTDNGDGTYTYLPDPGFAGNETISFTLGTEVAWNRFQEYQPGTASGSTDGNPNLDLRGFSVWSLEWIDGGGSLESDDPWYRKSSSRMVWRADTDYWAQATNGFSWIIDSEMRHIVNSAANLPILPVVRWVNEFDDLTVDVVGDLEILWGGAGGPQEGQPSTVEVAIAHEHAADGSVTLLFSETVTKPIPEPTLGDSVLIPVNLSGVELAPDDALRVTQRTLTDTPITNASNRLIDRNLAIVPAVGAPTGSVNIDVVANTPPVARSLLDGYALEFGGSGEVDLGNPEALQLTGDQTIEMWLKPADFDQRRNPWAKAYAGEGTMTQETNGTINYYFGTRGNNSGSSGVDFQSFNTGRSLPLGEWTHIALVRDLSNGVLRWYFNGQLINEADALFPAAVAGSLTAYIGRGYVQRYSGEIDEVRVWNMARTSEDIADNFRNRLTGFENGLVGYWNFDEGSGSQVLDLSPNNLTGTLAGGTNQPVFVSTFTPFAEIPESLAGDPALLMLDGTDADGDSLTTYITQWPEHGALFTTSDGTTPETSLTGAGDALLFQHTRQAVELPHGVLDGSTANTVEFWMCSERTVDQSLVSGANEENDNAYLIWIPNATLIQFYTGVTSTSFVEWTVEPVMDGVWRHLAFVRDPDAGGVELFIDGDSQGFREALLPGLNIAPGGLWLAQEQDSVGGGWNPNENFRGTIDEVRIWSRARTASEIADDWNRPLTGNETGLRAYYPMDTDGDTLLDRSGNAFHGLLTSIDRARDASRPSVVLSSAPLHGELPVILDDPQGRLVYLPEERHRGFDRVGFRVFDGSVFSEETIHPIYIQRDLLPPFAVDATVLVQGGATSFLDPFFNDYHPEGADFDLEDFSQPEHGTLTFDGERFIYEPEPVFTGFDSFTYTLTDGVRISETATVTVEVTAPEEIRWINPAGGNFLTGANWSSGSVPGPDERAVIDLDGTYTVTVNANHTVGQIVVGAASGTQTLRQTGGTFRIVAGAQVGENGRFELAGGIFQRDGFVSLLGEFVWSGSQIAGGGTLRLEGITTFAGGSNRRFSGLIENAGIFEHSAPANLGFGQTTGAENTFRNLPGATFTVSGSGGLVQWNSGTHRFENEGLFVLDRTGSTTVNNVVLDNTGIVEIGAGADLVLQTVTHRLRADGAVIGGGRLVADSGATILEHNLARLRVSGATLQVLPDISVAQLELATGFLSRGAGVSVTVTDTFVWSGGQITGAGTLRLEGTTTYAGGTNRRFDGLIENAGAFVHSSTVNLGFGQTSGSSNTFRNLPGATFMISGSGGIAQGNPGTHRFENEGSFVLGGTGSRTVGNVVLDNTGSVEIGAGADLVLQTVTHRLRPDGTVTGEGRLVADSGTTVLEHSLGRVRVSGATLQVVEDLSLAHLELATGFLSRGEDVTVTVTDTFAWTGGQVSGAGTLRLEGTTTYSGGTNRRFNGLIENAGSFENTGTVDLRFGHTSGMENTFRNLPGATFTATGGGGLSQWNAGTHRFENEGSVVWAGGASATVANVTLDNRGTMELAEGVELIVSSVLDHSGTLTLGAGADLVLRTATHLLRAEGELSGAGRIVADSGTVRLEVPFPRLRVSGGTLQVLVDTTATTLDLVSGFLSRGEGITVSVTDAFVWSGGQIAGAGTLRLEGTTTYAGGTNRRFNGLIENAGSFAHTGTANLGFGQTSGGQNTFRNLPGGTFTVSDGGGFSQWSPGTHRFENAGTFVRSPGGTTNVTTVHFQNEGLLVINGGTFTPNGGFTQNVAGALIQLADGTLGSTSTLSLGAGIVTGTGTLAANITNTATLRPEPAPGGLSFTGNLTQGEGGRIELSLGPRHETAGHRSLTVAGALAANGTLAVQLLPGFDENEGAEFDVIGFASTSGEFAALQGFADNQGYTFDLLTGSDAFALDVLTRGSVPAPDSGTAATHDSGLRLQTMDDGSLAVHYGDPSPDGTLSPQKSRDAADFEYSLDLETWHPVDAILLEHAPGILRLQRPEGARSVFIRARR
ncbi:MAG: carboxypeptidase regulatory-like domain-containing protein [Opitutales bacterium]|nr:carboxypeptidase regulatory-like domain-containing protein [Opitutales bacterium]